MSVLPVYLIQGNDPSLVAQGLATLLAELGHEPGRPSGALVEEYGRKSGDDAIALGAVLDALATPPFLATRRLVVLRDAEALDAAQAKELASYLADPLDTSVLVMAATGKGLPAALTKRAREVGRIVDTEPGTGARARGEWLAAQLKSAPVRLDGGATARLAAHLGEDLARLEGILSTLAAAFGEGARIGKDELEPFLGSEGAVAPWDLSDALDAGDIAGSLAALARMLGAGGRHPLQILSSLHRHFEAMLRLDGVEGLDQAGAAALTKLSPYPAGKALRQSTKLGHDRIARAILLLAAADLDLRGKSGSPPEMVVEVLVARLAQLPKLRAAARTGRQLASR